MASLSVVPRFYLYGEPHRLADGRFVHVESLDDRSRPSEWTIRPHAHAELNHIFHVRKGGGAMRAEHEQLPFAAPCLIVVPAGMVHGFSWEDESEGSVITTSTAYLHHLVTCDEEIAVLFRSAGVARLDARESAGFAAATDALMGELGWSAPGHRAAVESGLLGLLVRALRARGAEPEAPHRARGNQVELVARLRERVEARFRLREPMAAYAEALHSSETSLRSACTSVAGQSPMQILDQRAILEAQRALLYSNLSVSQIANSLGFDDAAYFSRFFARHAGLSPRRFRDRHAFGNGG